MRSAPFVPSRLFCLASLTVFTGAGAARSAADSPLLPRQLVFGNPERSAPTLSPDGSRIAYLAPVDGVMNVWVAPRTDLAAARAVTRDRHRGVRRYFWAYTNEHVLYLQDKDGDENWRVYVVDLSTDEARDLTPFDGVQARIQELSPRFPDEALVAINHRDRSLHDLHRVNLRTAESKMVQKNEPVDGRGFLGFLTDADFAVRFGLTVARDGTHVLMRPEADGGWSVFQRIEPADSMTTRPLGFDRAGGTLYMSDSRGRDKAALVALDARSGEARVLAEDPACDIDDALQHPTEKTVQAAVANHLRKRWHVIDDRIRPDLDDLTRNLEGDVDVVSRSLDDAHWIVAATPDAGPTRYHLYDRPARRAEPLFSSRPALEGRRLARMHPLVIRARDGLELVSYLTLPPACETSRPDAPLPMVLLVHGGVWYRDSWGFNPQHQWLASRGYAVLSVNFRGSTGFGKRFVNAGDREWAGKTHDDLIDAVQWAVREKIADPKRVAIMGGSFGGYATLVGLTFTPETFAAGVSIVGPSSLVTLMENIPPYWIPFFPVLSQRVGDVSTDEGRRFLLDRSPLSRVEKIRRPLLIGQGANDPRVKQVESDQIVGAMQKRNIPVTYVLFPDEGHGFARPENRLAFYAVAEAFLARHLGGAAEPIGDDLRGSSITVPIGAAQVPGLEAALP